MRPILAFIMAVILSMTAIAQTQPSTAPSLISASDKAALDAAMNQEVTVEGVVAQAQWSRSGKVMNIDFRDADQSGLLAVIFERNRAEMDAAFGGDVARSLTGSKVRIKGVLKPYGGRDEKLKGRPQIIITRGDQITIVEPSQTAAAATQPK